VIAHEAPGVKTANGKIQKEQKVSRFHCFALCPLQRMVTSTIATEPKLQPARLRLSAIEWLFYSCAVAVIPAVLDALGLCMPSFD
jgi:hypothetical protein